MIGLDSAQAATRFILVEQGYAAIGERAFNAASPVIDWGTVKMQMLYLSGCAKVTRDARRA